MLFYQGGEEMLWLSSTTIFQNTEKPFLDFFLANQVITSDNRNETLILTSFAKLYDFIAFVSFLESYFHFTFV